MAMMQTFNVSADSIGTGSYRITSPQFPGQSEDIQAPSQEEAERRAGLILAAWLIKRDKRD